MFGPDPDAATCCCPRCRSTSSMPQPRGDSLRAGRVDRSRRMRPARVVITDGRVSGRPGSRPHRARRRCVICRRAVVCVRRSVRSTSAAPLEPDRRQRVRARPARRSSPSTSGSLRRSDWTSVSGFRRGRSSGSSTRAGSWRSIAVASVDGRKRRRRDLRGSNRALIETALDELRQRCRPFGRRRCGTPSVLRERRATFSLRPGGPPRPSTLTPVAGLILAGDWIETGLPATIESAVVSGHRAAAAALECLEAMLSVHRALSGDRAEREEPSVVSSPSDPQSAHAAGGPRRARDPHADGPHRDRAGPRRRLARGARSAGAHVRPGQLFARATHGPRRPRRAGRRDRRTSAERTGAPVSAWRSAAPTSVSRCRRQKSSA